MPPQYQRTVEISQPSGETLGLVRVPQTVDMVHKMKLDVRKLRESRGWTQEQLGARMGYTAQGVSKVELGKQDITMEFLTALAVALETTPSQLLSGDEDAIKAIREAGSGQKFTSASDGDLYLEAALMAREMAEKNEIPLEHVKAIAKEAAEMVRDRKARKISVHLLRHIAENL